jgi:hypothetical protein
MQLTAHNTTNAFIDACNDVYAWGGINDHGKVVIKEMMRTPRAVPGRCHHVQARMSVHQRSETDPGTRGTVNC